MSWITLASEAQRPIAGITMPPVATAAAANPSVAIDRVKTLVTVGWNIIWDAFFSTFPAWLLPIFSKKLANLDWCFDLSTSSVIIDYCICWHKHKI